MTTYPKLTYKKDGTPRIPRGWRKLGAKEKPEVGDRYNALILDEWFGVFGDIKLPSGPRTFIRRVINRTAPKKRD